MTREIRVLDVSRPQQVLFAVRGGDNQSPAWMDNRRLTFASNRDGQQKIYVVSADGHGVSALHGRPVFGPQSVGLVALRSAACAL